MSEILLGSIRAVLFTTQWYTTTLRDLGCTVIGTLIPPFLEGEECLRIGAISKLSPSRQSRI